MTRDDFKNRAIIGQVRGWVERLTAYATPHNVYCLMLIAMGFAVLMRPSTTAVGLLASYANIKVSSEIYAFMFITAGAYGINRLLGNLEKIWLMAPFLMHTILTWAASLVRADVALTAPIIYTAVCFWHMNQER